MKNALSQKKFHQQREAGKNGLSVETMTIEELEKQLRVGNMGREEDKPLATRSIGYVSYV